MIGKGGIEIELFDEQLTPIFIHFSKQKLI